MSDVKITLSAKDNASAVFANVRSNLDAVQRSAGLLGTALGFVGVAGIGGLVAIGRSALNSVDAFNDLRDATGASIENISALDDVAARTGTSFDTVQTALIKFNGALKDAKPGSGAEQSLKALGLSVQELKGLDPAEALLKTSQALAGFADDGNKARLTQELFGKSLKEVAPFLKDLAETGALNAKVTTEQAEAAESFNKQIFNLQKNAADLGRAITLALVPSLNELAIEMAAIKKTSAGFWDGFITQALQNPFKNAGENAAKYREELQSLEADRARLAKGGNDTSSVDAAIATLRRRLAYFREVELQTTQFSKDDQSAAETARLGGGRKSVGDIPGAPKKVGTTKGKDEDADFAAYLKRLDDQITKTVELSTAEQLAFDVSQKRLTLKPGQLEELTLRAQIVDELKEEEAAAKSLEAARKSADQYIAGLQKEIQATEEKNKALAQTVQEIGKTTTEVDRLVLSRLDDAIATQEQAAAQLTLQNSSEAEIEAMERKIALLKEQRNLTQGGQIAKASADSKTEQATAAKEFADTLQTDLKGAFSAAFRDTSGEPLQAFGDALANVLYTRAATALTDTLVSSLLGSSGGGGGGGAGGASLLASLFSFDGGGFTGAGARAGGLDGKGGFMAMLHPNETVLDHTKGQGAGQSVTVVQNFTVGDVASVSMLRQAVAGSERRIAAAMGRSMNYGGALA